MAGEILSAHQGIKMLEARPAHHARRDPYQYLAKRDPIPTGVGVGGVPLCQRVP